jgi:hypothetical protein
MTSKIILKCVKENKKLRIKFYSFVDDNGKEYYNLYNNEYNCKFPRDIRKEGLYYEVGPNDISLMDNGSSPFYNIRKNNIKIVDILFKENFDELKVFDISECVICMEQISSVIFIPCAHRCTCEECYKQLKKTKSSMGCPICRRTVTSTIVKPIEIKAEEEKITQVEEKVAEKQKV